MKILAVALADEAQRFVKGYPPRGARLLMRPNSEICRLASLLSGNDTFHYLDERVAAIEPDGTEDIVLCCIGLAQEESACTLAGRLGQKANLVFFGPQATAWRDSPPAWAARRVVGDLTLVWPELKRDAEAGRIGPLYRAGTKPGYVMPRSDLTCGPEMLPHYQVTNFVRGCSCPPRVRRLCPEYLYFEEDRLIRPPEEIVGEVISMPGKRIQLLDDDVASLPDYYNAVFQTLWDYRRQWIVNASDRLFEQPRFIRLMAKAGVKAVILNETFLSDRLERACVDDLVVKRLYRKVKSLQTAKILVGARLTLHLEHGRRVNYEPVAALLRRIDLDLLDLRFTETGPDGTEQLSSITYRPMVSNHEPGHVKNRFYAMEAILDRLARRPRRVGFYNTATWLLPWSMAYRQNFLEGLPYP